MGQFCSGGSILYKLCPSDNIRLNDIKFDALYMTVRAI